MPSFLIGGAVETDGGTIETCKDIGIDIGIGIGASTKVVTRTAIGIVEETGGIIEVMVPCCNLDFHICLFTKVVTVSFASYEFVLRSMGCVLSSKHSLNST